MDASLQVLLATASTVAVVHTLIGVDHSLPFVMIGRARGWGLSKTLGITAVCGLAHVVSTVLLGVIGIGLGTAVEQLSWIQAIRGEVAAWGLIAFGLVYASWGLLHWGRQHTHNRSDASTVTLWSLFVLFALGPCEALIPLLMAPAWDAHWGWVIAVVAVFGGLTLATMLVTVTVGFYGMKVAVGAQLERAAHVLAGGSIAVSGLAIHALGI